MYVCMEDLLKFKLFIYYIIHVHITSPCLCVGVCIIVEFTSSATTF